MAYLLNTILGTLVPMCVTALVTMAITMIFKTSSTTNFAQGVISAFGAYVVANFMMEQGANIWLALPVGMLVSMAIAIAIDVVIFRNGRYVNSLGKQIITMGLISLVVGITPLIFGLATPYGPGDGSIQQITCPVALTMGEQDIVVPSYMVMDNFNALGDLATLLPYENCGHSPMVDCPDRLAKDVLSFFA